MTEQTMEGVVFRKTPKSWGDKTFYSFKFDGKDGWYRLGTEAYDGVIESGYTVKVGYETDAKGNRNIVPKHVKKISEGEPVQASRPGGSGGSAPRGNSGGGGSKSNVDWELKDQKIQYQSARNAAIEVVKLHIDLENLALPAKTKKEERRAAIDGYVDQYTAKFFTDVTGFGAVSRADDETSAPSDVEEEDSYGPEDSEVSEGTSDWDGAGSDGGEENEW